MWEYFFGLLLLFNLYKRLNIFLIRRRSIQPVQIMKGAEPYLLQGKKTGVLFLHGFTCTPGEGKPLGKYLNKHGFTFYAPLLPGHGTSPERLCLVKWDDWIKAAQEAINTLDKTCKEIYVIGNSFGGNLALCIAQHPRVKGLILMGTPIEFRRHKTWRATFEVLKHFKLFQKKRRTKAIEKLHEKRRHRSYTNIPIISLGHMLKVVNESKKRITAIDKPVLILQAKSDTIVHRTSAHYLFDNLKSKDKHIMWMTKSYHNLVVGTERTATFKAIKAFLT